MSHSHCLLQFASYHSPQDTDSSHTDLTIAVLLGVCSFHLRYCQRDLGTQYKKGDVVNYAVRGKAIPSDHVCPFLHSSHMLS